jgi:hypothetical protein
MAAALDGGGAASRARPPCLPPCYALFTEKLWPSPKKTCPGQMREYHPSTPLHTLTHTHTNAHAHTHTHTHTHIHTHIHHNALAPGRECPRCSTCSRRSRWGRGRQARTWTKCGGARGALEAERAPQPRRWRGCDARGLRVGNVVLVLHAPTIYCPHKRMHAPVPRDVGPRRRPQPRREPRRPKSLDQLAPPPPLHSA